MITLEAVGLVIFACVMRWVLRLLSSKRLAQELVRFLGALLPLLLIVAGILAHHWLTIVLAGFCLVFFPMAARRTQGSN